MNKKLFNKLSRVAFILTESEFVHCDVEIDSERIFLCNWRHGLITTVVLLEIVEVCNQYNLCYFVDFESKRVVIHG